MPLIDEHREGDVIGRTAAILAAAVMVGTPLQAQSIGPFAQQSAPLDARATVGITIPLGGQRGDIASRPRAELRLGQGAQSLHLSDRATLRAVGIQGSENVAPAPGALAVTLGFNPRWIAGGRVLGADEGEGTGDDDRIDTLEGIGIGVGIVLLVGAATVGALLLALDCDEDCS